MLSGPYGELRDSIGDGDILFIENTKFLSRIVNLVTNSPYSHAAIAFWINDSKYESRLFIVEAHLGGRRIINLSTYKNLHIDVIKAPVPFERYANDLVENTGAISYSYGDFVTIGFRELLGIKLKNLYGEVCSEMVANCLVKGGLKIQPLVSPGKLFKELVNNGFEQYLHIEPVKGR